MPYELRIYTTKDTTAMVALSGLLRIEGVQMFRRTGIQVLGAWVPELGWSTCVLLYLCHFSTLVERESAWRRVAGDARWTGEKSRVQVELGRQPVANIETWWLTRLGRSISVATDAGPLVLGLWQPKEETERAWPEAVDGRRVSWLTTVFGPSRLVAFVTGTPALPFDLPAAETIATDLRRTVDVPGTVLLARSAEWDLAVDASEEAT